VTAGTLLHRTRLALRVWFLAIFFVGRHKSGISALQLQKDLGLGSYKTAWALLHKLRSALWDSAAFRLTGLDCKRRCYPFAWTATPGLILEKLERLGKPIAGTRH
jgi:hypothetical protein